MMTNDKSAYLNISRPFWKLDSWEDDLRRRRRLVRNPYGSAHHEAIQKSSSNDTNDDLIHTVIKEENLLKQLKQQKTQNINPSVNEEEEMLQVDEKDLDQDFTGPILFLTECTLVCGTAIVHRMLAMIHYAMLFDTDEYDESFAKLNPKMFPYIDNLHGKWHSNEIRAIFSRKHLLQHKALEIFVSNRTSVMFAFNDCSFRFPGQSKRIRLRYVFGHDHKTAPLRP